MQHTLDDNELPPTAHFTRFSLPHTRRRRIHPGSQACYNPANHHLRDRKARRLDDSSDRNDRTPDDNLSWSSENVAGPDGRHGTDEASDVVDRRHGALHVGGRVAERVEEVLGYNDLKGLRKEDATLIRRAKVLAFPNTP